MPKWPFCNTETNCMVFFFYPNKKISLFSKIGDYAATIFSDLITKGEYLND